MASAVACNETIWVHPTQREIYQFERDFDYWPWHQWFTENWTLSLYFVGIYLMLIYAGQEYMKSRPAYELRGILFLWNFSLASFSIFSTCRIVPELIFLVKEYGFHYSVCEMGSGHHKQSLAIYALLFAMSKVVELGDTAFVILRKQKLIFLHWYHHVTVLLFVWYATAYVSSTCRWFMIVNYFVHSFMYTYYALKVLRVPIPRQISMMITVTQLVQMVAGVFLTAYSYSLKSRGKRCCVHDEIIKAAIAMYVSYFLLFSNFFIKVYAWKKSPGKMDRESSKKIQ